MTPEIRTDIQAVEQQQQQHNNNNNKSTGITMYKIPAKVKKKNSNIYIYIYSIKRYHAKLNFIQSHNDTKFNKHKACQIRHNYSLPP